MDDERIRQAIIEFWPRLVVIDPIQAYLGSDSDLQIAGRARKLMQRLGMWASVYDCAIVLIGHLNKKEGTKGLYRSLGSIDVVAAARSVLQVDRRAVDERIYEEIANAVKKFEKMMSGRIALIFAMDNRADNSAFYHMQDPDPYNGKICPFVRLLADREFEDFFTDISRFIDSSENWKKVHIESITEFMQENRIADTDMPGMFLYNIDEHQGTFILTELNPGIGSLIGELIGEVAGLQKMLDGKRNAAGTKTERISGFLASLREWASPRPEMIQSAACGTVPGSGVVVNHYHNFIVSEGSNINIQQGNQYANLTQTNGISLHGTMCQVHTDMEKQESEQNE